MAEAGVKLEEVAAEEPQEVSISHGLTSSEAEALLKQWGRNELPEEHTPSWMVYLLQMKAPMPIMIWIAIIIELAITNWADAAILIVIQFTNATIGWYETMKSGNAVAALKASLKPEATVKRDGKFINIDAALVVPGDCVLLASGSAVPADCMVNEGRIEVDQSALTGESLPVKMAAGGKPRMGSTIVRGEVEGTVVATGINTFFGKTADLLNANKGMDHLQKVLLRIVIILTIISIVLCFTCFLYIIIRFKNFRDAIEFSVVVLVASIPLALEIVVTTTLALGSRQLAREGAIVTRLAAIEDMSGMNILCSDKTGTLTLNKMVIQEDTPTFQVDYNQYKVLVLAALAAKWREPPRDALDTLVLGSADLKECDKYTQLDFTPFDPSTKRTVAVVRAPDGTEFSVAKGAPQVILGMCSAANKDRVGTAVNAKVAELGSRGIRSLAVAKTNAAGEFEFIGILSFLDPPRPDSKDTILRAYEYGVDVKMITGDQLLIGRETARQLGMGINILDPSNLPTLTVGGDVPRDLGEKYGDMCYEADGFAQVYPEHKFLIIEALRQSGFGVGMTGDGVNDAPALKQADVGVAVQGATDAARAAADIVLTQPGLSTIITGIQVARQIFQRMQNFLTYRIAATLQLVMFFFIALFALEPVDFQNVAADAETLGVPEAEVPIWPEYFFVPVILLMLITLLNDGTMIAIGYDRVKSSQRPAKWNVPALFLVSSIMGAVSCFSALLLLYFGLDSCNADSLFDRIGLPCMPYGKIVMLVYLKVAVGDFLTLFSARTGDKPFYSTFPSPILFAGAALSLIITTIIACVWPEGEYEDIQLEGLALGDYRLWPLWVWLYSIFWFFVQDALKLATYWALNHFDIFQFSSGKMVAVRDKQSFEDNPYAAGALENKALDTAIAHASTTLEELARKSQNKSLARVSAAVGRARPSADLRRRSLIQVDEAGRARDSADIARLEREMREATEGLGDEERAAVAPYLSRVSAAASNLRRVSAAVDLQRNSRAVGVSRRSIDPKGPQGRV